MANPVKAFDFEFVKDRAVLSLPGGIRDGFWQQPDLFGNMNYGQPDKFEYIHNFPFVPVDGHSCRR
jgi:hypothetical protein